MAHLTDEQANQVFDILLDFGANESYRKLFVEAVNREPTELQARIMNANGGGFRFPNDFGFALTFGFDARFYVGNDVVSLVLWHGPYVSEQMKNIRRESQKKLNERLGAFRPVHTR